MYFKAPSFLSPWTEILLQLYVPTDGSKFHYLRKYITLKIDASLSTMNVLAHTFMFLHTSAKFLFYYLPNGRWPVVENDINVRHSTSNVFTFCVIFPKT